MLTGRATGPRKTTTDQLAEARAMHAERFSIRSISNRIGARRSVLQWWLADEATRERWRAEKRARQRLHPGALPHREPERLPSIPPDTRDLTGRVCGDPLPGRSALDKMAGAAVILIASALFAPAVAHHAESGLPYPWGCCSSVDCYALEPGEVEQTQGGWLIKTTREVIPYEDVQEPLGDDHWHRCTAKVGDPSSRTRRHSTNKRSCLYPPEPRY